MGIFIFITGMLFTYKYRNLNSGLLHPLKKIIGRDGSPLFLEFWEPPIRKNGRRLFCAQRTCEIFFKGKLKVRIQEILVYKVVALFCFSRSSV